MPLILLFFHHSFPDPTIGSAFVVVIAFLIGPSIKNGIDTIARGIDSVHSSSPPSGLSEDTDRIGFNPISQLARSFAAIFTLGSGCSLGPEGPSVEIGAAIAYMLCGQEANSWERRYLFLAGTAAGVSAGFGAPIAGVFFALE